MLAILKRSVWLLVTAVILGCAVIGLAVATAPTAKAADTYQLSCWPYGPTNFGFGQYVSGWGYHTAEDVCHEAGIPVYAAADGVVMYSAQTPPSYRWGNLIIIQHRNPDGNYVSSLYGHLNTDRRVSAGQNVSKGQRIGTIAPNDYNVNGGWDPHTHFGIHNGPYGYPAGTYAPYIHGYEPSCCGGWLHPSNYVNARIAAYDHVPFDVIGGGEIYNNGEIQVTFRVQNSGSFTWRKDGTTPVRLGTVGPRDRPSGFSANGTANGWSGANRIKLNADTGTGGLATFTATFKSNGVPGTYPECFSPVVDGGGWMPERPICVSVTILPPQWRGEWYGQMITTNSDPANLTGQTSGMYLRPNDKLNLKLFVKNVGELPWETSGNNMVRLATSRPNDRGSAFAVGGDGSIPSSENWPWYNRPSGIDGRLDTGSNTVVADTSITTGEIAVFSYTVKAPSQPGTYQEYFNPVAEGHYFMRDLGMWFPLRVLDPGLHYEWVTQSSTPTSIGSGVTAQDVTVRIKNTGQESWPVNGDVRLGTDRPRDYASSLYTPSGTEAWLSPSRLSAIDENVTSPGKQTVDTNEVAEFRARLTVPENVPAGNYQLYVKPVKEGVAWFPEDYGMYFPVNVTVPPYRHQVVHQSYVNGTPGSMPRNSTLTARIGIRNTGRMTWQASGPNAVRLGTERPRDRASGFNDFGVADPWLALNRASGIDGRVTNTSPWTVTADTAIEPNEIAAFSVPVKANPNPGSYNEYFNLVMEGVTWYPDLGIFIPFTVTP